MTVKLDNGNTKQVRNIPNLRERFGTEAMDFIQDNHLHLTSFEQAVDPFS